MKYGKKLLLGFIVCMLVGLICSCNRDSIQTSEEKEKSAITRSEDMTEMVTNSQTESASDIITEDNIDTSTEITTEVKKIIVSGGKTEVTEEDSIKKDDIGYSTEKPLSYKEAVNAHNNREPGALSYVNEYWIQHDDKFYSMNLCYVNTSLSNKLIMFAMPDFAYIKAHPGDLVMRFGGSLGGFKIAPIELQGYTIYQNFKFYEDEGCVEFYRTNLAKYMDNEILPLSRIYEINGETASDIQDYIDVDNEHYLSYSKPTKINYKYYHNYESNDATAMASVKYWVRGKESKTDTEEAPEGYAYYKIPEDISAGMYCIYGWGDYFIVEIAE